MTESLIELFGTILWLVSGFYILFMGRKALWATLGIIGLVTAAILLAVLVAGYETGNDLIDNQEWALMGIAVGVGVLGMVVGRAKPGLAALIIGFAAGAYTAVWLYDIAEYLVTAVVHLPESMVIWVALAVIIVGGLLGIWLVRQSRDEALIFITMLIGVLLMQAAITLRHTNSWTAIIFLSLALAGVLVQYAQYLREVKANSELAEPEPLASSVAYFQDIQFETDD